jgi:hypothetical protein
MVNSYRFSRGALGLLSGIAIGLVGNPATAQSPQAPDATSDAVPIKALAQSPAVAITNGSISARVYLPDVQRGFYRGLRFDWAGVIGSLTYRGHEFYVPWFQAMSNRVWDFVFQGDGIIASANSAATGPVEEFNSEGGALGYADAAPGGTFLKIGVGVLRRPDATAYSSYRMYPMVDAGRRTVSHKADRVVFTHEVADAASGYAYHYIKTVRLVHGAPSMMIEHELRNTGTRPISTSVYDHNFLSIDGAGTVAGLELSTRFTMAADKPPSPDLAVVSGKQLIYRASLSGEQRVAAALSGFGPTATDYSFHIIDPAQGAGLRITANRPLQRVALWSIRPVMAIEPFITMTIKPGATFRWSYRYDYEASRTAHEP